MVDGDFFSEPVFFYAAPSPGDDVGVRRRRSVGAFAPFCPTSPAARQGNALLSHRLLTELGFSSPLTFTRNCSDFFPTTTGDQPSSHEVKLFFFFFLSLRKNASRAINYRRNVAVLLLFICFFSMC